MTALVTGGTGFVGRNLVERLLERGERVRCLARSPQRAEDLRRLGAEIAPGDVASGVGLDEALRGVRTVYHCAGVIRAWTRDEYFATNASGTGRLASAARRGGAERFVLVSSLAASGPAAPGHAVTEETETRPMNAYGRSKLEGERLLAEAAGDMRHATVRPAIVYGPHDRDVLVLFRAAARGFVPYAARRDTRVSFIHARDLADLLILAADRAPPGRVYMASDGVPRSWVEAARAIAAGVGRRARVLRVPPACLVLPAALACALRWSLPRPPLLCLDKVREAAASWVASPARARAELGWTAAIGLDEGARMTAEWYRAQGWL